MILSLITMSLTELNNEWTLFFHEKNDSKNYVNNTIKLISVNTIKDFWGTVNNIPRLEDLFSKNGINTILRINKEIYIPSGYSFCKNDFYPSWETFKSDGDVSIKTSDLSCMNNLWERMLVITVGNYISLFEDLLCVRVVDSSYNGNNVYKMELWFETLNYNKFNEVKEIVNNECELEEKNCSFMFRKHRNMKENYSSSNLEAEAEV